jgi:hypothetical protein
MKKQPSPLGQLGFRRINTGNPPTFPQFVRIERGCVVIHKGGNPSNAYDVSLSRIPDYHALAQWVLHLCEKDWFDTVKCLQFIECVCESKGWTPHTPQH